MSKKITLLGSPGSIGTQSLDVIRDWTQSWPAAPMHPGC